MTNELVIFHAFLLSKYENAVVNLVTFQSGAATLDMRINDLLLTFEHAPQKGFAVSRIEKDEDAWDPQKCMTFGEGEFNEAREYFLSLIDEQIVKNPK
jgi:hypothetical protein